MQGKCAVSRIKPEEVPAFFEGLPTVHTDDGFWMVEKSLAELLVQRGIFTFPNDRDEERECGLFYDDWYLYAVPDGAGWVYSLVKLREQEHDAECGRIADGDTPGVTVSFLAFSTGVLKQCWENASFENRKALNQEINRVVAARGQTHHPALKCYFRQTGAQAPYLIARQYVEKIASLAENGQIALPDAYQTLGENHRLLRFIRENNTAAGYTVCDRKAVYIRDAAHLSQHEMLAILATHTGDTSFFAFAAEVQYHAKFLTNIARIPIPFLGRSVYDSAIRADMTIADNELEGPAPYHNPRSAMVREQMQCHPDGERTLLRL